jgi:hypothetical protein
MATIRLSSADIPPRKTEKLIAARPNSIAFLLSSEGGLA